MILWLLVGDKRTFSRHVHIWVKDKRPYTITLHGELMPELTSDSVNIAVTAPDATVQNTPLTTDANGNFALAIVLSETGTYTIAASYAGDGVKYGPISQTITVTAVAAPPPALITPVMTLTADNSSVTVGGTVNVSGNLSASS